MAAQGQFVIRHTEGSGPRRNWTYLTEQGWVEDRRSAAGFAKRQDAYAFARVQLGDYWMDGRVNAVRNN